MNNYNIMNKMTLVYYEWENLLKEWKKVEGLGTSLYLSRKCKEKFLFKPFFYLNPLSGKATKLSNKQLVGNCQQSVSVFDHFVGLALKGLTQ